MEERLTPPAGVRRMSERGRTSDRARIWKVLRGWAGEFTSDDICQVAEVAYTNLITYFTVLEKAGYIRKIRRDAHNNGHGGYTWVWRLAKNTGPLYPRACRLEALYDPNTGAVWHEDAEACQRRRDRNGRAR